MRSSLGAGATGIWRVPSGAVDRRSAGARSSTVSAASRITLQPAPAGVDDAGLAQHGQLLGRARQGLAGRGGRGGEDVAGPGRGVLGAASAAASEAARATVRMVPSTGVPTAA